MDERFLLNSASKGYRLANARHTVAVLGSKMDSLYEFRKNIEALGNAFWTREATYPASSALQGAWYGLAEGLEKTSKKLAITIACTRQSLRLAQNEVHDLEDKVLDLFKAGERALAAGDMGIVDRSRQLLVPIVGPIAESLWCEPPQVQVQPVDVPDKKVVAPPSKRQRALELLQPLMEKYPTLNIAGPCAHPRVPKSKRVNWLNETRKHLHRNANAVLWMHDHCKGFAPAKTYSVRLSSVCKVLEEKLDYPIRHGAALAGLLATGFQMQDGSIFDPYLNVPPALLDHLRDVVGQEVQE